jgi:hypothetical protein
MWGNFNVPVVNSAVQLPNPQVSAPVISPTFTGGGSDNLNPAAPTPNVPADLYAGASIPTTGTVTGFNFGTGVVTPGSSTPQTTSPAPSPAPSQIDFGTGVVCPYAPGTAPAPAPAPTTVSVNVETEPDPDPTSAPSAPAESYSGSGSYSGDGESSDGEA